MCIRWEKRITSFKNVSYSFLRPGTTSVKKDTIKSHCLSEPHKYAVNLDTKSKLGEIPYLESVVQHTPIGKAIKNMCAEDKNACHVLFNSAYYLAKQERPFLDFSNLLKLQEKNKTPGIKACYRNDRACGNFIDSIGKVIKENISKDLAKARYFCVLSDGSTDTSILEEELVYILYFDSGKAKLKFLSIVPSENVDAVGIHNCIKKAFERIGILNLSKRVIGLNVDGAAVNTGIHNGVGALMKKESPWLQVIHCFNHSNLQYKMPLKPQRLQK